MNVKWRRYGFVMSNQPAPAILASMTDVVGITTTQTTRAHCGARVVLGMRFDASLFAEYGSVLPAQVGDGKPPVAAEGARRDLDAGRGLPPLVLVEIDGPDHAPDQPFVASR